ncbi:hypothetical protein LOY37_04430 [Pseudomonas sp. B21-012]|uniref:hypothetical protein n=1 Tax=unclassified Pseudomonas TaxID=196821 RepID=UPI00216048A7|nr:MULTISPECIES: hypothetical protein [unclassified Pseudomonas]UVL57221.1 hypothetical protein LOY22_04380 [Pseudomonas sp. B21-035]UVL62513.1 hypothetical protein LOY54_04365 [Pseudomonas sp. B21-032]UVM56837.1 hypothetical protein LOY37_04430 [Pseudomonas sp. B21-012]UVM67781.1 hypothetical protein LOY34_04380 [Pseudomonas sp. B21-009]
MNKRIEPRSERDYTTRQIIELLDLRDSASLGFIENGMEHYIQTSHCSEQALLSLPYWPDALWTYRYETSEWVPVFRWAKANTISIDELVDKAPNIDPFAERPGVLWCTPKGHPREQFHRIVTDETGEYITDDSGDRYPLPQFDEEGHSEHFYTRVNNPGICQFCKQQVEKRVNYRDPEEGCCRKYEICRPCHDHQMALAREADARYDD